MSSRTIRQQCEMRCLHFKGIQNVCAAGIDPVTVRDASQPGPYRWPCLTLTAEKKATTTCAQFRPYTEEEIVAEESRINAAIDQMLGRLRSGKCVACEADVKSTKQVGPCIYAQPCGHRQGQGDAERFDEL